MTHVYKGKKRNGPKAQEVGIFGGTCRIKLQKENLKNVIGLDGGHKKGRNRRGIHLKKPSAGQKLRSSVRGRCNVPS